MTEDDRDSDRWSLDGVNAILLGAAIARERTHLKVSIEGLAKDSTRTEEWLGSIERGEVAVTRHMGWIPAAALNKRDKSVVLNVDHVVDSIRREPYGETSNSLRQLIALSTPTPNSPDVNENLAMPELIADRDRVLVLGPWLLLIVIVFCAVQVLDWSMHGLPAGDLDRNKVEDLKSVLIPAGVIGTAVAALGLRAANELLKRASKSFRTREAKGFLHEIKEIAGENQIAWQADNDWRADGLLPHLIPRYRERTRAAALRTELTERCLLALSVGFLSALAASMYVVVGTDVGTRCAYPIALATVLGVALLAAWNECARSAADVHAAISRGLGYAFENPKLSTFRSRRKVRRSKAKYSSAVDDATPDDVDDAR